MAIDGLFHTSKGGYDVHGRILRHAGGPDGWGDSVTHYYIIEDMLKLDPKAILWLYDNPQKSRVEAYMDSLGEWFRNNGNTFSETLACVMERREGDTADEAGGISCFAIIDHL
jgi:hypothetical protein